MGEAAKQMWAGFWVVGTKGEVGYSPQEMTNGQDETMREQHNPEHMKATCKGSWQGGHCLRTLK